MRQLTLAVAAGALLFATQADAGSFPVNTMTGIETGLVDTVAVRVYVHEGRRYCFYFDGWHGPGWYRCGFAWRQGIGWGGVYGWNSWSYGPYERRHHHHGNWQDHRRGDRIGVESGSTTRSRSSVESRTRTRTTTGDSKQHPRAEHNRPRQWPRAKHDRSWRCRCAIRRRRANTGRKRESVHGRQRRRQRRWRRQRWRRRRKEIRASCNRTSRRAFARWLFFAAAS